MSAKIVNSAIVPLLLIGLRHRRLSPKMA